MKTSITGTSLLIDEDAAFPGGDFTTREGDAVDDSLLVGWSASGSHPKDTGYAALSTSRAKSFAEDPQRYYLQKIKKVKEPMAMPLIFGIAGHYGLEVFLEAWPKKGFRAAAAEGLDAAEEEIQKHWHKVEDRTVRENVYNLANPRGRQEVELSRGDLEARVSDVLWDGMCLLDEEPEFPLFAAQRKISQVEASLGEMAKTAGLPHHTIESYDPGVGKYGDMLTAVIAGVPVRGRIDAVGNLPSGRPVLIDHKFVTKVVSYYPPYNGSGPWTRYDPSYNVTDSVQLDFYSVGTGVKESGFQFFMRRPQYMPEGKPLYDEWVRWDSYNGTGYPAFIDEGEEGAYAVALYRESPSEAEQQKMWERAYVFARACAQAMTESHILLENGVEPEIAFPAGSPEEIGRKACPYCFYGPEEENICPAPRLVSSKSKERASKKSFREQIAQREEICEATSEITDRRAYWHERYGVRSLLTP